MDHRIPDSVRRGVWFEGENPRLKSETWGTRICAESQTWATRHPHLFKLSDLGHPPCTTYLGVTCHPQPDAVGSALLKLLQDGSR
jgi:hypothetical protein